MPTITLIDPATNTVASSGQQINNNAALRALLNGGIDGVNLKGQPALVAGEYPQWDGIQFVRAVPASVPTGTLTMWTTNTAPSGWLICDGSAVLRATYTALHSLYSAAAYPWGSGDGVTTFGIPDIQGRIPVGKGTHVSVNALAANDGTALSNRSPKHRHTVGNDSPDHSHNTSTPLSINNGAGLSIEAFQGNGIGDRGTTTFTSSGASARHSHAVGPGAGTEPLDSAAFVVVQFIVKT